MQTTPCTPASSFRTDGPRKDGWSPPLVAQFLEHLAGCGNFAEAARQCGRSESGMYALCRRHRHIGMACEAARQLSRPVLHDALMTRALRAKRT